MYKISDYKLVSSIIKSICRKMNTNFSDIEIDFSENKNRFIDNKIVIEKSGSLSLIMYKIVEVYINNFEVICGKKIISNDIHKFNILNAIFNYFRYISEPIYGEKIKLDKPVAQRLYQQELVWSIMKNIVCPAYNKEIDNCLVFLYGTPKIDISFYFENENSKKCVILNTDVGNEIISQASLLCDVMRLHDICPNNFISEIEGTEIFEKICGIAKLSFDKKDSLDFMYLLKVFSGKEESIDKVLDNMDIKVAQTSGANMGQSMGENMGSSWWFLGLIEKLLEPARGSDWSTYQSLEPFYKELQQRIDEQRKKSGRGGLTYEALLRINSGEVDPKDIKLIEKNLSSDRIW